MLKVNQQEQHLGMITFGETKTFTYRVTNKYDVDVELIRISKSCNSCTEASFDTSYLKPNETAIITVNFTPGSTGIQSKSLTLIYKTGQNTTSIGLEFKAMVNE